MNLTSHIPETCINKNNRSNLLYSYETVFLEDRTMCLKSDILKTKAVLSCHSFVHGNWRDKPVGLPRLKMNVMIIKVTFWKADPFPIHLGRKSLEVSCAVQLSKHDSEKRLRDKDLTQPWNIALVPCWLRYFSSCRHYQEQKDNPDIQWKVSIEPTFVLHLITGM